MCAKGNRSRSAKISGVVQNRNLSSVTGNEVCRPRRGSTSRSRSSDAAVSRKEIEQPLAQRLSCLYVEPPREELQQFERPVAVKLARDPAHALEHPRLEGREDIVLGPLDVDLDELRRRRRAVLDNRPRCAHFHLLPPFLGRPGVVERESAEIEGRIRGPNLERSFLRPQGELVRPNSVDPLDVAHDHRVVFRNRLEAMNLGLRKAVGEIKRCRADVGTDIPDAARVEPFRDVVLRLGSPPQQDLVNYLRVAAAGPIMQPAAPPAEAGYGAWDVA